MWLKLENLKFTLRTVKDKMQKKKRNGKVKIFSWRRNKLPYFLSIRAYMYDLFYNLMINLRQHLKRNDHRYVSCLSEQIWKLWYVKVYKIMKISENYLADSLGEKCANTEFFSGPYFSAFRLNTERYKVFLRIQSKCRKNSGQKKLRIWTLFKQ